jgi:hypothetical protein
MVSRMGGDGLGVAPSLIKESRHEIKCCDLSLEISCTSTCLYLCVAAEQGEHS